MVVKTGALTTASSGASASAHSMEYEPMVVNDDTNDDFYDDDDDDDDDFEEDEEGDAACSNNPAFSRGGWNSIRASMMMRTTATVAPHVQPQHTNSQNDHALSSQGGPSGGPSTARYTKVVMQQQLAQQQETRRLRVGRAVVLTLILMVAAAVTVAIYVVLRRQQKDDFRESYDLLRNNIHDALQTSVVTWDTIWHNAGLTLLTSVGVSQQFPFVSLATFEDDIGALVRSRVGGIAELWWAPRLTALQVEAWNTYSNQEDTSWWPLAEGGESTAMNTVPNATSSLLPSTSGNSGLVVSASDFFVGRPMVEEDSNGDASTSQQQERFTPYVWTWNSQFATAPRQAVVVLPPSGKIQDPSVTTNAEMFLPQWMTSPPPPMRTGNQTINDNLINVDRLSVEPQLLAPAVRAALERQRGTFSPLLFGEELSSFTKTENGIDSTPPQESTNTDMSGAVEHGQMRGTVVDDNNTAASNPASDNKTTRSPTASTANHVSSWFSWPVTSSASAPDDDVVGILGVHVSWEEWLAHHVIPSQSPPLHLVVRNTCGQTITYETNRGRTNLIGEGDRHQSEYSNREIVMKFYDEEDEKDLMDLPGVCLYSFHVYPTKEFEESYYTILPAILALIVGVTFVLMVVSFLVYDCFVKSRNRKVMTAAAKSNAIISSMFPSQIRDQLLAEKSVGLLNVEDKHIGPSSMKRQASIDHLSSTTTLKKAIADFYSEVTIMFADIVGFTAWSSQREPSQVFELLETIYAAFDELAKMRRVFKVETVGDCYVACAGLPEPRQDHAVAMARFARECLSQLKKVLKRLEIQLGPDTGDLTMRVGLHSGSVTAGVLRGERARFQLFGDTMNTASRMESTGLAGKIQISQDTADLLKAAGKENWIVPRDEMITAKGKGMMVTYWLSTSGSARVTPEDAAGAAEPVEVVAETKEDVMGTTIETSIKRKKTRAMADGIMADAKKQRLVQWTVSIMQSLLKCIVVQRDVQSTEEVLGLAPGGQLPRYSDNFDLTKTVLDEVQDAIRMPGFSRRPDRTPNSVVFDEDVTVQMHDFVSIVATLYCDHPFHNFEHACHVTMAALKLMSNVFQTSKNSTSTSSYHKNLTFSITSDPLVHFACFFAAMIHDVDHPGVTNIQLIREKSQLAAVYKTSIAEQNSFDLAWNLFMDDRFIDFRGEVCRSPAELARFRQLVVNLVMATDITDKHHNQVRRERWDKAFGGQAGGVEAALPQDSKTKNEDSKENDENGSEAHDDDSAEANDRRATIVIESLIQAADVCHTMQHWHIYRKWNEKLFTEMYETYLDGRSDKDPSEGWYKGELGFFDFYVIPLARKLSDSGVFGSASSEYLDYALRNRREWESRGRDVLEEMILAKEIALDEEDDDDYDDDDEDDEEEEEEKKDSSEPETRRRVEGSNSQTKAPPEAAKQHRSTASSDVV